VSVLTLKVGVDLKKAAKLFAQRFATGGSVTKNAAGIDEIVVQGDVSQEIYDMIVEANDGKGGKKGLDVLKDVLVDNIEMVEEKRKKGRVSRCFRDAFVRLFDYVMHAQHDPHSNGTSNETSSQPYLFEQYSFQRAPNAVKGWTWSMFNYRDACK
jgi:hypothetical protein